MTYLHTSSDGLLRTNDADAVARWDESLRRAEAEGKSWTERLRAVDVVLAHPDDGWVHRNADGTGTFSLSWYPQFCDVRHRLEVGMLVAFGIPPQPNRWDPEGRYYQPRREYDQRRGYRDKYAVPESANHGYRICRVTEVKRDGVSIIGYSMHFAYKDTGIRYPEGEPSPLAERHPRLAALLRADRWDRPS